MVKDREIYSLIVVIIGNFNPVIITPFWLSSKGFIRETEAETAKVVIVHPDITRFEIDWLSVEVTRTRFELKTRRESHFSVLRDLVVSIFSTLKETPITAFGINHLSHFSLKDTKEYANFGYWLSPVQQFESVLNNPKVQSVQYSETRTENENEGVIRLGIYPSDLIKDDKSVVFNCNHHFENFSIKDTKEIILILVEKWEYSFIKSNQLNNLIWEKARL
ncbi:MAG TPA: hypothetical protein VIJ75_14415 [Hanamia sp.]